MAYRDSRKIGPVICIETGERFESCFEAAKAHGVKSGMIIADAAKSGGVVYKRHYCLEGDEGYKQKPDQKHPVVCVENGKIFRTMADAAAWAGTSYSRVARSVYHGQPGTDDGLHFCGLTDRNYQPRGLLKNGPRKCRCVETGQSFESATDAARYFMTDANCVLRSMKTGRPTSGRHFEEVIAR